MCMRERQEQHVCVQCVQQSVSRSGKSACAVGINMQRTHPNQRKQPLTEPLSPNPLFSFSAFPLLS